MHRKPLLKLHIGGKQAKAGWKILNAQAIDGVDYIGDVRDLSAFEDGCCDKIYASHVMEHVPQKRPPAHLTGNTQNSVRQG